MMLLKKLTTLAIAVVLTCSFGLMASAWVMGQTKAGDTTQFVSARVPQAKAQSDNKDEKEMVKKAIEADLKRLDGTWQLVALEIGGKAVDPARWGRPMKREFLGTTCLIISGERVTKSDISIDHSKTPKWMDETNVNGKRFQGIYELKGDTLRLFMVPAEEQRPTEFKTREGTQQAIATYERVKPADAKAKNVQGAKDEPVDPVRAGKGPVVLRVKGAGAVKASAVVCYQVEILAVLKNSSGQVFGKTVEVCGSGKEKRTQLDLP